MSLALHITETVNPIANIRMMGTMSDAAMMKSKRKAYSIVVVHLKGQTFLMVSPMSPD